MYYNNVLESIGNTPLIKINRITKGIKGTILAKVETSNPGNSVKDRMALQMVEDAEADGTLKPGGTIIEGTSGNTGMGLALAAIVKGYKLICTLNDKQSKEKMDVLRAMGAEVIVCPTNVAPEDPKSYYSVARRLHAETPNSIYVNQYDNPANAKAHYQSTGPEIWEQTEGKITHFLVGVGTGGTISGVGKYLKEKNPNIKVWGIDTYGSVFKKYHETGIFDPNEIYPYITEGIGEDILPKNVDFEVIDLFEKVTDRDAAIMTRRIAREEGIFVGNSAGAAMAGVLQLAGKLKDDDVLVVLFHDHGSRYVGKMFNDDWMRDRGFLDGTKQLANDILRRQDARELQTIDANEPVIKAIVLMGEHDISQLPVTKNGEFVGALTEQDLYSKLIANPALKREKIETVMGKPFPIVGKNSTMEEISRLLKNGTNAVLVQADDGKSGIITRHDVIKALS